LALLAVVTLGGAALAETKGAPPADPEARERIRVWNAECLSCHTFAALQKPPRKGMDLRRLANFLVVPELYNKSNHTGMACRTCHVGGYREYPHETAGGAKPEILDCNECHAQKTFRIDAQVAKSVHSKNLKARFTCTSCHDPHVYVTMARLASPEEIVRQDNHMCLDCHNSDRRFAEFGGNISPPRTRPDIETTHGVWLPNPLRHWQAVRCIECHTPPPTTSVLDVSHEILGKEKAERKCVTCHTSNTALRTRLYRYVAEEETAEMGFVNSAILGSSYVIGATRHPVIDSIALGLIGLSLAVILVHGFLRIVTGRKGKE
jgi:hypothetical protein